MHRPRRPGRGQLLRNAVEQIGEQSGDGSGRNLSYLDVMTEENEPMAMNVSSRKLRGSCGSCRVLSSTGGGIRTHTLVPQERILSPQRLPGGRAGLTLPGSDLVSFLEGGDHDRADPRACQRFGAITVGLIHKIALLERTAP
jgi:hypothetical protein